jgi:predicted nucleic acid-binding protein
MILADASVWIDHLRELNPHLSDLIATDRVAMHPHVLGEIALGSLRERRKLIARLERLPAAPLAREADVLRLVENRGLFSTGIGWTDAHLLASCRLLPGAGLWTRDKRLQAQAARLQLDYRP